MTASPNENFPSDYRIGFILSTLLGNKTRYNVLRKYSAGVDDVECVWAPVRHYYLPDERDPVKFLPGPLHTRAVVVAQSWPVLRQLYSFDAVMVHQFEISSILGLKPNTANSPIIVNAHDNPPVIDRATYPLYPEQRKQSAWRAKLRVTNDIWAARRAGYYIGFSEWSADIMRKCDLDPTHVVAQHVGLDLEAWTKPNTAKSMAIEYPRLLFVGGDFDRKGGRLLLDIFTSELSDRYALDIVTKTEIASPPPNCRVFYNLDAGDARLIQLFHEADVFVLPTEADLVPWVILEAMASQCAIVASNIGGIPDMVSPDCGILIDPTKPSELYEALRSLANNPARRKAMGVAARSRIEKFYDASKNVPKIFDILKGWIDERRLLRGLGR